MIVKKFSRYQILKSARTGPPPPCTSLVDDLVFCACAANGYNPPGPSTAELVAHHNNLRLEGMQKIAKFAQDDRWTETEVANFVSTIPISKLLCSLFVSHRNFVSTNFHQ